MMISFTVHDQFHSTRSVSQYMMISFTVHDQFYSTCSVSQYMISFTVHDDQFHSTWWSVSQYMMISFTIQDQKCWRTYHAMDTDQNAALTVNPRSTTMYDNLVSK